MFSLTLYRDGESDNPPGAAPSVERRGALSPTRFSTTVKTTMMFHNIANPRRTTLAHLADAEELQPTEQPEHTVDLPTQTANPRRTVLMEMPVQASAAE